MPAPHPYPNAWYRVADARDLRPGQSIGVSLCGSELALFRSDITREVAALDGHCAHLGAALAGAKVKDGCLHCPFHGWMYNVEGRVQAIPYAKRVPKSLGVKRWPVREVDGQIFVWHGMHGSAELPQYPLDDDPDIISGALSYRGRYDAGTVNMTVFDFAENGPDIRHFAVVHRHLHFPWTQWNVPGCDVYVSPTWHTDATRAHVAWLDTYATVSFLGRPIEAAGANARVEFIGPGSIARFHFDRPDVGRILLYQTHTPVGERALRVHFRWYAEPRVSRAIVLYVVGHWVSQWRDDVRIWERKVFRQKPQLIAEDGPVLEMRRWYGQFYGQRAAETLAG